jgi:hypothetical protein
MPLPGSIATKVVSLGKYYAADGTLLTGWTANVVVSQDLRYAATGDVILQVAEPVTVSADGTGLVRLPVSDQSGFVSSNNAPASGWSYTIAFGGVLSSKRPKIFQLPGSAPDPFDADNVPDGAAIPPSNAITTYVNGIIINGTTYTGTPDLTSALGTGVTGSTTVGGITDATPIGQGLLRSADTNAAKTVIGLQFVDNTSDANKPLSIAAATAIGSKADNTATSLALSGKVDAGQRGVANGYAPLDASQKLPLLNMPPSISSECVANSGVYPGRPATPNRVTFYGPTIPAGGGTVAGGGGAVDNYDRWVVTV